MKKLPFFIAIVFAGNLSIAQVGIGTSTPDAKAVLDITGTGKGLLIPRMDSATRVQISSPLPDGLMVFQNDGRKGFWYAINNSWLYIPDQATARDNMGNHTATQPLNLQNQLLVGSDTINGAPGNSGMRINSAGQVGIGKEPVQKLDVAGTAQAQQFLYSNPQAHYLAIPLDAFSSVDPLSYQYSRYWLPQSSGCYPLFLVLQGGTAGQEGFVSAAVNLPQGAVITKLEMTVMDKDGTSVKPQVTLSAMLPSNVSGIIGLALNGNATLTTEGAAWKTVSTPLNHIVRNDLYNYKVAVKLNQNSFDTRLYGVRISYTVMQPD